MLQRALKYFHTLRHLKPRQTLGRLFALLKLKLERVGLPPSPPDPRGRIFPFTEYPNHSPWNNRTDLNDGTFTFLNESRPEGRHPDWGKTEAPLLWRFHLHYFQYLYLLEVTEREELCLDWIEKNPIKNGVGWHPYPTSLRIVNWCKLSPTHPDILKSLYQQTQFLARHLEFYHPGNHYLENAKALIFAGIFFKGQGEANGWLAKGQRIILSELTDQVLDDGGYFERTTMYHALMLELVLDLLNIYSEVDNFRDLLATRATQMMSFLAACTHPDGAIALFNDSTEEIAPSTRTLLDYGQRLGLNFESRQIFPDSGIFVSERGDSKLIADFGPIGPDYLPAHAHADIFNFELSVHGKRIVVDTGVYEYAAGARRDYVRSTIAHNCPTVDDVDQAECWSSFRVARRYPPKNVWWSDESETLAVKGLFSGYKSLIGDNLGVFRHLRHSQKELSVVDQFRGEGEHLVASRLHLHPDVRVERIDESSVRLDDSIVVSSDSEILIENSPFYPRFGVEQSRKVLILRKTELLPASLEYTVRWDKVPT